MRNVKKTILIVMSLCAGLAGVCLAGAANEEAKARVIHFPKDRSIGSLYVANRVPPENNDFWFWFPGKYLAEAQGDVTVPIDKMIRLDVRREAWTGGEAFVSLKPGDIQILAFCDYPRARDSVLKDIGKLTGLEVFAIWSAQKKATYKLDGGLR